MTKKILIPLPIAHEYDSDLPEDIQALVNERKEYIKEWDRRLQEMIPYPGFEKGDWIVYRSGHKPLDVKVAQVVRIKYMPYHNPYTLWNRFLITIRPYEVTKLSRKKNYDDFVSLHPTDEFIDNVGTRRPINLFKIIAKYKYK